MKQFFAVVTFLFLWQFAIYVWSIPPYILPCPKSIFVSFYQNYLLIAQHMIITAGQAFAGFLCAIILGITTAILLDWFIPLKKIFKPLLTALQSTPTFILFPLFIIWFGYGYFPKIVTITLSCYFPIVLCTLDGLQRVPVELHEQANILNGAYLPTLWQIRLPLALSSIFSGLHLAAIHAPITVLAVDWMGASNGLGYLILYSHGRLQIDLMFACTVCVITLAALFSLFIQKLRKKIIFWPA